MRRGCREEGMALAVVDPVPETTCLRVLLFQLVIPKSCSGISEPVGTACLGTCKFMTYALM